MWYFAYLRIIMNNKNILIAITADTRESSIVNFISDNLKGNNLHITLCIIHNSTPVEIDVLLDKVSMACEENGVDVRIRHLVKDPYRDLENQTAYADLLIIQKETIRPLAIKDEFGHPGCAIMVLPADFTSIDNIILVLDGSRDSIGAIKQFFQVFSTQIRDVKLTLLSVFFESDKTGSPENEHMLIQYLKQYSSNVGLLKAKRPLTAKILKPAEYDKRTLVVGTSGFMLSQYGNESDFKPFFDDRSSLFLPAV